MEHTVCSSPRPNTIRSVTLLQDQIQSWHRTLELVACTHRCQVTVARERAALICSICNNLCAGLLGRRIVTLSRSPRVSNVDVPRRGRRTAGCSRAVTYVVSHDNATHSFRHPTTHLAHNPIRCLSLVPSCSRRRSVMCQQDKERAEETLSETRAEHESRATSSRKSQCRPHPSSLSHAVLMWPVCGKDKRAKLAWASWARGLGQWRSRSFLGSLLVSLVLTAHYSRRRPR